MAANYQSSTERAETAATHIVNDPAIDINGTGTPDAISIALRVLAEHDLLTFGFSDPNVSGPQTGDLNKACEVIEVLARHSGALASIYMVAGLLGPLCVSTAGTTEQKQAILSACAAGETQLAFAMTEPEAGSDAAAMTTTASAVDDGFALTGDKTYITGAATADWVLTVARTSPESPRALGVFLVPTELDGVDIEPLGKLAGNAYPSCLIHFDEVRLPTTFVLGGTASLETAWSLLRKSGARERLLVSAMACGLATAATTTAEEFITEREQFGRKIKDFQAVQHAVVEAHTITAGMKLFLAEALRAYNTGDDATREISMAKYFCSEQLQRVIAIVVRAGGGRSYFDFDPVSRFYREAPFTLFAGGTVEVQKMLIARALGI